ncbi:MAG: hypothetical protein OXC94_00045 [Chloroflexi bacterium]|nr:hypothetical protein [Chloroflexota bacterium]
MGEATGAHDGSGTPVGAPGDLSTGPAVGEPVPDFALPDQRGLTVTLSRVLRRSRALVVFHRSARW